MILKYTAPKVALLVFILFIFLWFVSLGIFAAPPVEKIGGTILFIAGIWLMIDVINTKQIEVYRDRIVKRVRIPFPTQRNRVIYYDRVVDGGVSWIGIIFKERWRWGLWVYTFRLKKEDEMRFYEFLSQISGRPKEFFMYRPIYTCGFKKLIKEESHGTGR